MKQLNKTTQKAEKWISEYNKSNCYSVECFYGRCSSDKVRAEKECIERMNSIDGYGYRILNGNCFYFTCGYKSKNGDKLYIETASNTFEIEL